MTKLFAVAALFASFAVASEPAAEAAAPAAATCPEGEAMVDGACVKAAA